MLKVEFRTSADAPLVDRHLSTHQRRRTGARRIDRVRGGVHGVRRLDVLSRSRPSNGSCRQFADTF